MFYHRSERILACCIACYPTNETMCVKEVGAAVWRAQFSGGEKDRWGCRVGRKSQYFITDSIGPELGKFFKIFITQLSLPKNMWCHTCGRWCCHQFWKLTMVSRILVIWGVSFITNIKICCCVLIVYPEESTPSLAFLLHLALWNVISGNQWKPVSLPSPTVHLAVWNVLIHRETEKGSHNSRKCQS